MFHILFIFPNDHTRAFSPRSRARDLHSGNFLSGTQVVYVHSSRECPVSRSR